MTERKRIQVSIVCRAESHEGRTWKVARFERRAAGWVFKPISGNSETRDRVYDQAAVVIQDDRPVTDDDGPDVLTDDMHTKWRFRCGLCGLDVQFRGKDMGARFEDTKWDQMLNALWEAGVSEVDLEALARTVA